METIIILLLVVFAILHNFSKCDDVSVKCQTNPLTWQNAICCRNECSRNWTRMPLLLVSLDGFRADYLLRDKTPSLQSLIDCGSHAPYIYSSFPTKTFPNHYTIVTGLYPESHGIVDNYIYDPNADAGSVTDKFFNLGNKNPRWWKGEPFWNTVTKNGMKSASYFWPGSDVKIQNKTQTYMYKYNESVPFYQRIDQVISWLLMNSSSRPDFLSLYLSEPDAQGHNFGPQSPEVTNELIIVDAFVSYLMRKIFENNLLHCVNVVIMADHGMQTIFKEYMKFTDYVDQTNSMFVFGGPVGRITLANSTIKRDDLAAKLMCKYDHAMIFKVEDVPKRLHYSNSKNFTGRIGDLVVVMEPGYLFSNSTSTNTELGNHGFDYKTESMHALFLAYGPKFKQNYTTEPFQNIELYNLFCGLLDIPPSSRAPNNGTEGRLDEILRQSPSYKKSSNNKLAQCDFVGKSLKRCGICQKGSIFNLQFDSDSDEASIEYNCDSPCSIPLCQAHVRNQNLFYSPQMNMPVLHKFLIKKRSKLLKSNGQCTFVSSSLNDSCSYNFDDSTTLKSLNVSLYSLNSFDEDVSKVLYTKVPMFEGFYNEAWTWLQNLTLQYGYKYEQLLVSNGAIFDYNSDGLKDSADMLTKNAKLIDGIAVNVPTHFYQILHRCNGRWSYKNDECDGDYDVLSFILPHQNKVSNCLTAEKYFALHTSRIRDIELLTGLQFFKNVDFTVGVRLRTKINEIFW